MFENIEIGTPVQIIYNLSEDMISDNVCLYLGKKENSKGINYFYDGDSCFAFSEDFMKRKNMILKFDNIDFDKLYNVLKLAKKENIL